MYLFLYLLLLIPSIGTFVIELMRLKKEKALSQLSDNSLDISALANSFLGHSNAQVHDENQL